MKALWICVLGLSAATGVGRGQTTSVARLGHSIDLAGEPSTASSLPPNVRRQAASPVLRDTPLSRAAANALFVHSDLLAARRLAAQALQADRADAEALFVRMEAAAMQSDDAVMLDSAVRLCEAAGGPRSDARVQLAVTRVREAAGNTTEFRKQIPAIEAVLARSEDDWPELNAALLAASQDGAPGLDSYAVARAGGVLTEWRIVALRQAGDLNPFGDADNRRMAESDGTRAIENFQFPDGLVRLPEYFPRHNSFAAASTFSSGSSRSWRLKVETAGTVEVTVDGTVVLRKAQISSAPVAAFAAPFDLPAGPHCVLVRFGGLAAPFRLKVMPLVPARDGTPQARMSRQEVLYLSAAARYATGDFRAAAEEIQRAPASVRSAPSYFLLAVAPSKDQSTPTWDSTTAWDKVLSLSPGALSADAALSEAAMADHDYQQTVLHAQRVLARYPGSVKMLELLTKLTLASDFESQATFADGNQIWSRRLLAHPSCEAWQAAIGFYREQQQPAAARLAQQGLDGCAPESLAYAQSLADAGNHAEAVQSLRKLIAAAPLNRAALVMLVRELQLAGEDLEAQKAAAEWLRIAPNATNYRRLAALETNGNARTDAVADSGSTPFYAPYRREVLTFVAEEPAAQSPGDAALLLDDHVAIARPDGSVSLYVHKAIRVLSAEGILRYSYETIPTGAQLLARRIIGADGTVTQANSNSGDPAALSAGDTIDEEYVVHYTGDGGMAEHSEVFQFVFGAFAMPVAHARFVVLTPARQGDPGAVIVTGNAPKMTSQLDRGMLARVWEANPSLQASSTTGLSIVRVVEQENGWSVPRDAERRRRIETIHPGPRIEES